MKNEKSETPPIGTGHAAAMARLGLHELRAAFYPDSNVAQHGELGLYGTATPAEVTEVRRGEMPGKEHDVAPDSVLGKHLQQAERREPEGRDSRDMDRE